MKWLELEPHYPRASMFNRMAPITNGHCVVYYIYTTTICYSLLYIEVEAEGGKGFTPLIMKISTGAIIYASFPLLEAAANPVL